MINTAILRGDVFFADLDPVVGSEQGGRRPVLVIQNNTGNRHSPTVIVAAITSRAKPYLPTHLPINGIPSLKPKSVVLLEQLRTIDKSRLGNYVGSVTLTALRLIDASLAVSLGMKHESPAGTPMTLCHTCKAQFEEAGFRAQLTSNLNDPKESCDYCNHRTGFTYNVEEVH
jgi:mRNA interferase MazF